jgi:hypothetical protein
MRPGRVLLICIIAVFLITAAISAAVSNPLEWLDRLEEEVLGKATVSGGILDRLNKLEEILIGRVREGTVAERLERIEVQLYQNQPHDISLIYKIQAIEWVLYKEQYTGALTQRLSKAENLLLGEDFNGSVTKRLERLITHVFPGGAIRARWATIPEGQLIKVRLSSTLDTSRSKPGDSFQFTVSETVFNENAVLFPKGTPGRGWVDQIRRPANLGRDAIFILKFHPIRALDGTPVTAGYSLKAQNINRSRQKAVGASVVGMAVLGPEGILLGMLVRGKDKTIPAGTEIYLQVNEAARIYTLER